MGRSRVKETAGDGWLGVARQMRDLGPTTEF
jgi:hypothetical protein